MLEDACFIFQEKDVDHFKSALNMLNFGFRASKAKTLNKKHTLIYLGTGVAVISFEYYHPINNCLSIKLLQKIVLVIYALFKWKSLWQRWQEYLLMTFLTPSKIIANDTTNVKFRADLELPDNKLVHMKRVAKWTNSFEFHTPSVEVNGQLHLEILRKLLTH